MSTHSQYLQDTIDDVIITFRGTYQLASIEVLSLVDSLHYVFNLKNNKRDGVGISYYSNGAIKWISNYEDNKTKSTQLLLLSFLERLNHGSYLMKSRLVILVF